MANAQAQRRDPDSLLSWFKLLIERYRECPEPAWGDYEIPDAGEPSVLVQRGDIDAGTVIAVHNLADTPVEARLVLDGKVTLALAPYGTRWLRARSG